MARSTDNRRTWRPAHHPPQSLCAGRHFLRKSRTWFAMRKSGFAGLSRAIASTSNGDDTVRIAGQTFSGMNWGCQFFGKPVVVRTHSRGAEIAFSAHRVAEQPAHISFGHDALTYVLAPSGTAVLRSAPERRRCYRMWYSVTFRRGVSDLQDSQPTPNHSRRRTVINTD